MDFEPKYVAPPAVMADAQEAAKAAALCAEFNKVSDEMNKMALDELPQDNVMISPPTPIPYAVKAFPAGSQHLVWDREGRNVGGYPSS